MTTIWHAGRTGQARMQPTTAELGAQIRLRLQDFTAQTSTVGAARDKAAVGMVRSQYPASRGVFTDAALTAVLREPAPSRCNWDAFRDAEPAAIPTAGLRGLLGSQCTGCRIYFAAREIAERELAHIAQVQAAGTFEPSAPGRLRTPAQIAAARRSLTAAAKQHGAPAPTGAIWTTPRKGGSRR